MNIEGKYIFGIVAVICLCIIQGIAFLTGHNGQILSFTTAGITSLITFLLGLNITSKAQNTAMEHLVKEILDLKSR